MNFLKSLDMSEAKHSIKISVLKELRKEIFPYVIGAKDIDLESPKVKN